MGKQEKLVIWLTVAMLVLAAVIVVLVWGGYSNWFKTDFEHIYLVADGKRLQQSEVYRLGNVEFDVRQFGLKSGYAVNVFACPEEDFTYTVDGKYYNFVEELGGKDVTAAFDVVPSKRSFVLHARIGIRDILQKLYPDNTIEIISNLDQPIFFRLVVTDRAGNHCFEMKFRCLLSVTDIEVDPDHVFA